MGLVSSFCFYVVDILLATNTQSLFDETKSFLKRNFEMKDLGEASYILGIEIKRQKERFDWIITEGLYRASLERIQHVFLWYY